MRDLIGTGSGAKPSADSAVNTITFEGRSASDSLVRGDVDSVWAATCPQTP